MLTIMVMHRFVDTLDATYRHEVKLAEIPGGAEQRLRRFGGLAGAVGGAGLGALFPVAMGAHSGGRITEALHDLSTSAADAALPSPWIGEGAVRSITEPTATWAGRVAGGALGVPLMPLSAGLGGALGFEAGRSAGGLAGSAIDAMRSQASKALAESRSLPLSHAATYLAVARRTGAPPQTVAALARDYAARREEFLARGQRVKASAFDMGTSAIAPPGSPNFERVGTRVGRGLGAATTIAGSFALPFLLAPVGGAVGQGAQGALQHLGTELDIPEGVGQSVGQLVGGVGGGLLGLKWLLPRTVMPLLKGAVTGQTAGTLGAAFDRLVPESRRMVSEMQKLSPEEGYAFLKSVERAGNVDETTLDDMRKVYEARRLGGVLDGEHKVSAFDPLEHPQTSPAPRRPLGRLGLLAGSVGGAVGGYYLGEHLMESPINDISRELAILRDRLPGHHLTGSSENFLGALESLRPFASGGLAVLGSIAGSGAGYGLGKGLEQVPLSRRHAGINRVRDVKGVASGRLLLEQARADGVHPNILAGMEEAQQARELARADLERARPSVMT